MSSSSQTNSLGSETTSIEDQDEFSQVVCDGRSLLENKVEFQTEEWAWTCDLDDGGIFVFSYLLYDYKQKVLSLARLKESVYTLNLLRHKMLPEQAKTGLSMLGEFQVIFCGKTLQNIPQNQEFIALLKTAKKQGVKIFACGISLTKFNLSKKDVPPGLPITENGILHAFQLQKQGFLTLSI